MAELRPFRGLRYQRDIVGDIGAVLAPPYDVIDAEHQAALHERSLYNVVRLELGEERPGDSEQENRYTRAAATLDAWRSANALAAEPRPAFYIYVQNFELDGRRHRRTVLYGRLRLEPWEHGAVRPHEETMRAPKEDRLQLLRHLRTQVSPILALYNDPTGRVTGLLSGGSTLAEAETPDGQRHALTGISDRAATDAISESLRDLPVYVLDGHHRYETALAYRNERRTAASGWTGAEPENFAMVALASIDDPGLQLLPTHRLVRPPSMPADVVQRLDRFFHVEDVTPKSFDGTALLRLLARLTAAGSAGPAFGALGLEEGRLHLLTLSDARAVQALMPDHSKVWQGLDVSVLEYGVLRETLGLQPDAPGTIDYTDDAARAMREVEAGRWPLAFLLNATRVEQVLAVADARERMPAKSTYLFPKLPTGLVLNAFA